MVKTFFGINVLNIIYFDFISKMTNMDLSYWGLHGFIR